MRLRYRHEMLDPAKTTGVLLCGMGGPDTGADVRPFLQNLFSDPQIIPIPRLLSPLLARLIAWRRTPAVRARYAEIHAEGGSPQLDWTRRQGERLEEIAADAGFRWACEPAMRYWHPYPDEAIETLRSRGAEQFLAVPMYPQYSDATNGSILNEVEKRLKHLAPEAPLHTVPDWHRLPGFVTALADSAAPGLNRWIDEGADPAACALLFVAHSLPESFVAKGDPYVSQTRASVAAIHAHILQDLSAHAMWLGDMPGGDAPLLAFQSRVGPIKWVGPEVTAEATRLAASGCRKLHVQPVSFTCEHIETLHELDIELKEIVQEAGIEEFSRGPALNLNDTWLASLSRHLRDTAYSGLENAHVRT